MRGDADAAGAVSDVGPQDVEAVLVRDFAPAEVPAARALLATYGTAPHERDPHLIRLGLLRLASGDPAVLAQWTPWARMDWRDVLAAVHQRYGHDWVGAFLAAGER